MEDVLEVYHRQFRRQLNQYQSEMCISGVLESTDKDPRLLKSPLGPNRMATDCPV